MTMSPLTLQQFLETQLMQVYAKALKSQIDRLQFELCYGCQQGRSDRVAHNVCQMTCVRSKVELCLVYALDRVEDSKVMESYAEQMGLVASSCLWEMKNG